jgi:flagellar biosynthesis/type III secretory pathway protein FliH
MAQSLSLECFETGFAEDASASETFKRGYEDGLAAGAAHAAAERATLNEAFIQNLSQVDFTYAEARGQLLASLEPLLSTIISKVLPHCVTTGFANQLSEILQQAAAQDSAESITLHIHPSQRQAVENNLKNTSVQVSIHEDPSLNEHAAWIKHNREETHLDLDSLLAAIGEVLGAIHHPENRTETNG